MGRTEMVYQWDKLLNIPESILKWAVIAAIAKALAELQ